MTTTTSAWLRNLGRVLLVILLASPLLTSCEETNEDVVDEYSNWTARNDSAFASRLQQAKQAIKAAQTNYGNDWENHCNWRILRNYTIPTDGTFDTSDSIPVEIIAKGTGTVVPLYSDSVRANYVGRLIPTSGHPNGYLFANTGTSVNEDETFSDKLCTPALLLVSNNVQGFATALQHMHIGDLWRIYIHPELGYGESATNSIPKHSMLTFTIQLKGIYRKGQIAGDW